jgi:hypothetical protein
MACRDTLDGPEQRPARDGQGIEHTLTVLVGPPDDRHGPRRPQSGKRGGVAVVVVGRDDEWPAEAGERHRLRRNLRRELIAEQRVPHSGWKHARLA